MEEGRLSGFCIKAAGGNVNVDGTKCGRWNPTKEQLKILTDLFRSGVRTPTTDQIQKISNQLSFYGKIESKNVFYWFQNHKARERHKRRKLDDNFLVRNHPDNIHFSSPKCMYFTFIIFHFLHFLIFISLISFMIYWFVVCVRLCYRYKE